jgi:hypothetical protein
MGDDVFRVVTVPLALDDATAGTAHVATSLDQKYAQELERLAGNRIADCERRFVLATTLSTSASRQFESASPSPRLSTARSCSRANARVPPARRGATRCSTRWRRLTKRYSRPCAMRCGVFALIGVFDRPRRDRQLLARPPLSEPIGALSDLLTAMAASHDVSTRLPVTGSSRELDTLTRTFNALMASVGEVEAQTQSAYTGAIRALATALTRATCIPLDTRTVSAHYRWHLQAAQSAGGRRRSAACLGALLHDIGKIGVPDDVLRKPGVFTEAEFDIIKQHPVISTHAAIGPLPCAPHSDCRAPPRAAGRPRVPPWPARR